MVAGVVRLGAYGKEDLYLTYEPQITFFKNVFKRHTFFSQESIDQSFSSTPNFGGKFSCILAVHGDLLLDVLLRINLPAIPSIGLGLKVRWVDSVACALVKKVEFEINGAVVSTLTGEWIRLYLELIGHKANCGQKGSHRRGLMKMIRSGDHGPPAFEDSLSAETLYLPLPFWFTRSSGQAFPIAAIHTREVRINVEFNSIMSLLQYSPTHAITILEKEVFFREGDVLYQGGVNDERMTDATAMGVFVRFDKQTHTLYYNRILGDFQDVSSIDPNERLLTPSKYLVRNMEGYFCSPSGSPNSVDPDLSWFLTQRFALSETVIMARYAFISSLEKSFFYQKRHEYIIEQLQIYSLTNLGKKNSIQLVIRRPCSEIIWVAQLQASSTLCGLPYNYTDLPDGTGKTLVMASQMVLNSESVYNDFSGDFYGTIQGILNHPPCADRMEGINLFSFALKPDDPQPSGSVNMSKIEKAYLRFQISAFPSDAVTMRVFARTWNVLVIQNGLGELMF